MAATHAQRTFKDKLQAELDSRGWGVRTLARQMANGRPERVESQRRQLRKYLEPQPVMPTQMTRHAIEDALGVERDALKPDDEEEGDQPMRVVVPLTVLISDAQIERALDRALAARIGDYVPRAATA